MLFNTPEYFFFFLAVLTGAWALAGFSSLRILMLLAASFYFYASNNSWQTLLLLFTTTVDYWICLALMRTDDPTRRRHLLLVSVVSNLGLLAWFKYANFFGDSVAHLAELCGVQLSWITLNIALPVGISFYTFEALSYTIDVYRRRIPAEPRWTRLAFLVTFFPHLIAGPIIRAADFFPQIGRRPTLSVVEFERSLALIASGLIKKLVFADSLAVFADAAFDDPASAGTARTWLGVYAFAFQIYFDFSGYTDIAIGCARLLGFNLPENFCRPYAAASITDFWRRWHISLSTWLRDYLYISLGGNRMASRFGVYRNLMITMLLGGLWHGAAWTFVLWGLLHGLYLCAERAFAFPSANAEHGIRALAPGRLLAVVFTFHVVVVTWLPFRAEDLGHLGAMLRVMFTYEQGPPMSSGALLMAAVMLLAFIQQNVGEKYELGAAWLRRSVPIKSAGYAVVAALVIVMGSDAPKSFIYFRF